MSGLDKEQRLREEREENEIEAQEPARLDPKFPYRVKAFVPSFFGLPKVDEEAPV